MQALAGPDPPVVVGVHAACEMGQVVVEFSQPMDPLTAADPTSYRVEAPPGGPPPVVGAAQLMPPGSIVLLQVEGLVPGNTYVLRMLGVLGASGVPVNADTGVLFQCPGPVIIQIQPEDCQVCAGTQARFFVAASGPLPLEFVWLRDGRPETGGSVVSTTTESTLTLPSPAPLDDGAGFSVRVFSAGGTAVSATAVLRVLTGPAIRVPPASQSAARGGIATLVVAADGSSPFTYEWRFEGRRLTNGTRVSGADSPALVLSQLEVSDSGGYSVTVSNLCGSVASATAFVTVVEPPVFLEHPVSVVSPFEAQVQFHALAVHNPSYQWYRNGVPIPGATAPSLVLTNVQRPEVGVYHAEAMNLAGKAASARAHLQVLLTRLGAVVPGEMATDNLEDLRNAAAAGLAGAGPGASAPSTLVFHGVPLLFCTTGATKQSWEVSHCTVAANHPMWLLYHSPRQETLRVSTEGSDFDTVLAVCSWDGDPGHPPVELAPCDNNGGQDGRTSRLRFPFEARKDYYLVVDGVGGATGTVRIEIGDSLLRNYRSDAGTGAFRFEMVGPTWATNTLRSAPNPGAPWSTWTLLLSMPPTNRDWVLSYANEQARQDRQRCYGARVEP
jgi:hypothetical protein